jgi:hypothetical protein
MGNSTIVAIFLTSLPLRWLAEFRRSKVCHACGAPKSAGIGKKKRAGF